VKVHSKEILWGHWSSVRHSEAILLLKLHSSVKISFIDDLTLSGDLHTVERDITTIMESSSETGLQLNVEKM